MSVVRRAGIVLVGLGFVGALGVAPIATADTEVPSGSYDVEYPSLDMRANWTMVPCGPDCTAASSTRKASFVQDWEFRLADGTWRYAGSGSFQCADGAFAPAEFDYGFDARTLAGEGDARMTTDACGDAPGTTHSFAFQLTRTG